MKIKKHNRMAWTLVIAIGTSILAFAAAWLQYKESIENKDEQLAERNLRIKAQEENLSAQKELKHLTDRNNETTISTSAEIIALQAKHQKELQEKTDEINKKNEELIVSQKELNAQVTGGDVELTIFASPGTFNAINCEIEIQISNDTKYTQPDVKVEIMDNFKFLLLERERNAGKISQFDYFDKIKELTLKHILFEKIHPGESATLYKTNLSLEIDKGFIEVRIDRHGKKYQKRFIYQRYANKLRPTEFIGFDLAK